VHFVYVPDPKGKYDASGIVILYAPEQANSRSWSYLDFNKSGFGIDHPEPQDIPIEGNACIPFPAMKDCMKTFNGYWIHFRKLLKIPIAAGALFIL
jgi:hypothetical protein